jgi:hypothetical protein
MPVVPASLESYVRGGNAFIDETPVEKVATLLTYTGDQDNYLFLHKTNGFTISTVNHGAAAPSTPALSIPLAKVVTTYNVITSIVDLRDMNAETVSEPLVDVPWDWGIHSAETIKLIGLRSGKYYDLKTVTLHRNSEDCEVHLFRCPFVSDEPGNARSADDYSLYQIASKTWWSENQQDNITSYTKITRIGVVIVDGVVGAELFGMGHIFLPSSVQPRWTHFHLSPENGNFMYPPGGLVEATVLEPDIPASYIGHGIVTVTGDTHTFDAQGYCSSIIMPLDESSKSFGFTKKLEGQPLIRAINRQSQAITGTLKTYLGTEQIDTESVSIPASGICVIPSKHQAVMDFGTVTSGTGTTYIMSGVNVRDYTGFTLYAKDRNDPVTPLGCTIVSHNTTTGEMVLGHDFGTDGLLDGDEVSVHLPYSYKLIVGTKTVSFDLRNRSLAFATMLTRVGTGMLLYDATNATGALLYDPATGALLYDA